jgi:hypothetical protein
MSEAQRFTTPVGRFVSGSADERQVRKDPVTKQPKLDEHGQLQHEYFIGVAVPKDGQNHWAHSDWGKIIWAAGFAGFPGQEAMVQSANFAWKIIDGDSQIPNRAGKVPAHNENYRGCWILQFKTSFAPQLWNADGSQQIPGSEFKRGYYVQVSGTVRGNGTPGNPGVYLNHDMIALSGYGEIIHGGPDVSEAGFGGALPPGASATPVGQFDTAQVPMQPVQQPAQTAAPAPAQVPGQPAAAPSIPAQQPAQTAAPAAAPGQPHTAILNPPSPPQG